MRGQKVMDTFYDRLKETWSYHTHHPGLPVRVGLGAGVSLRHVGVLLPFVGLAGHSGKEKYLHMYTDLKPTHAW